MMWEEKINIHEIAEIRARTTVFLGVGAIQKMDVVSAALAKRGISKVLVVTGKSSHVKTGAWDTTKAALDRHGIGYTLYSKVTPNPTVDQVDEAAAQASEFGATAVIAIGGGSPIDTGKSAAIVMANPGVSARDIYEYRFIPEKAAPIVAINLTHGTGTEINRVAVASIPESNFKPAIVCDCIYPLYSIDDPALMTQLPADQTLYVSIDAMNHALEAATTKVTNPYAIMQAKEAIRLVARYVPAINRDPHDLTARYFLTYASMIAGASFDNGLLHLTHALEHPLSGVKPELTHGLGLAMLLPAVVRQIYPVRSEVLADLLAPIVPNLRGTPDEAEKVYEGVKAWLKQVGIEPTLRHEGFTEDDIDRLTKLAFETPSLDLLLSLAPIAATKQTVSDIYLHSL